MKKILAFIQALCIASLAIMPTVSNANYYIQDLNSPELAWLNDGEHILLDKKYNDYFVDDYIYSDEQIKNTLLYSNKEGTEVYALIPMTEKIGARAVFNLTKGTTEEEVNALLAEKFSKYCSIERDCINPDFSYSVSCDSAYYKKMCGLLKEENFVDSFVIIDNVVQLVTYSFAVGDILGYDCSEEQLELMKNYVKETDFADIQVVGTDNRGRAGIYTEFILKPKTKTTDEERFDIAFQIWESTGIGCNCVSPVSNTTAGTSYIDVFNAVDGDANEDGKMNMADATAVVQAIGNPDKYALTPQGCFNADTDSDGITGADALGIQMKVAEAGMPE